MTNYTLTGTVPTTLTLVGRIVESDTASSTMLAGLFGFSVTPHAVHEAEALAAVFPPPPEIPTFVDPSPSIVSIVADALHNVVATVNAGPTDAGAVSTWWEVEYVRDNGETLVQIDYTSGGDFSTNHNHSDTFVVPQGLDFSARRFRFVIQAIVDGEQIWRSPYFTAADSDAFNNDPPQLVFVPTTSNPPQTDFRAVLAQRTTTTRKRAEERRLVVPVRTDSRYKLTAPFVDAERTRGPEYAPMGVLEDFFQAGANFRTHVVRETDVGFLDQLAVMYYGPGNERLWWIIAYANAMVDPERDMRVGGRLVIPPRSALQSFLTRKPSR